MGRTKKRREYKRVSEREKIEVTCLWEKCSYQKFGILLNLIGNALSKS